MGTKVGGVTLDTKVLDRITAEIKPKAHKIIGMYGYSIMGDAARNAPVDTGALRSSITAGSQFTGDLTFIVQDGVAYGIYQELGTHKMAAHPFLVPALEKWRDKFLAAFAGLFK